MDIAELGGFVDGLTGVWAIIEPYVAWARENWVALALTGEIAGAVLAIMMHRYRLGFGWLIAALGTIWAGGMS